MTDKELSKLTRQDLLELLLESEKENEALRREVEQLQNREKDRQLQLEKVGSIAEAALVLNDVFSAAQAAADQYVLNVKRVCDERAKQLQQSEDMLRKARLEAKRLRDETEASCRKRIQQAKTESEHYWSLVHGAEGIRPGKVESRREAKPEKTKIE